MDGRGQEGDYMYNYISRGEVKPYHEICTKYLKTLQKKLRDDHKIHFEIQLVGSGSHRLVTRNGKEPFDLDYNLIFHRLPEDYGGDSGNPGKLKALIRQSLDKIVDKNVSFGQDSTSSIKYNYRGENGKICFSFDVAILYQSKERGILNRLIHQKDNDSFIWNEVFDSKDLKEKEERILKRGLWNDLRDVYLKKKNENLKSQDSKPSYILYIEAVNEVCQKL
jgi:hypothetical protein